MSYLVEDLKEEMRLMLEFFISEKMNPVEKDKFDTLLISRYDYRTFSRPNLFYNDDGIMILGKDNIRSFNYYAGGEYIDEEYVIGFPDAAFYSIEDDRIREIVDLLKE